MSDTKAERLADALNEFIAASPDVEAAAVVSFDGLAMASALPPDMDEDRLGAMSAALLSLGEQAASGLGRGELNQVFVEGEHGYVFLMSAKDQAVLAAVTDSAAKIGLMLFEMRRAAHVVGTVLEGGSLNQAALDALPKLDDMRAVPTPVPPTRPADDRDSARTERGPARPEPVPVVPGPPEHRSAGAPATAAPPRERPPWERDGDGPPAQNGAAPAGTVLPPWN